MHQIAIGILTGSIFGLPLVALCVILAKHIELLHRRALSAEGRLNALELEVRRIEWNCENATGREE